MSLNPNNMTHIVIAGLGNPGNEYERTRHNAGRIVLDAFRKAADLPEWVFDKSLNALVSRGSISSSSVSKVKSQGSFVLIMPETFMNRSGDTLRKLVKSKKAAEQLVVVHDDLDIPFGSFKISFNKSSGGHKGVESIIRALKSQAFGRVRVGIASSAAVVRKSQDESAVEKTILGRFSAGQLSELKKLAGKISEALFVYSTESREKAMSQYNG